jgi:signal peptidase I
MKNKFFNTAAFLAVTLVTLHGRSMRPMIQDGDRLVYETVPFSDLKSGEIVTYQNAFNHEGTTTHRLIRRKANGWVTKGDNNAREDMGLCTAENLRGVVVEILPSPAHKTSIPFFLKP